MSEEAIDCCSCGIVFAVPARWKAARRSDGEWFYCPNGHKQRYTETEADQLRRQLQRQQQENARLAEEAAAARAQAQAALMREGKARKERDRIRQRVQGGACPDCNRTFTDLARHMATKHHKLRAALACTAEGHA